MSVEALATVLHHSRASGTAKLVLIGIANHDGDGGAWPTHATLARYANVSPRNVRQAIAKLVDLGEVRVEVQSGGTHDHPNGRRPNRYIVLVSCPGWCDRSKQHRDMRRKHGPAEPLEGGSDATTLGGSETTTLEGAGGSETTTVGGSLATTKPSLEPDPLQVVSELQDTREGAPCSECGAPSAYRCQRVQIGWVPEDRHTYTPAERVGQAQQREGAAP